MRRLIPALVAAVLIAGCGGATKTKTVATPQPSSQFDMHRTPTKQAKKIANDSARLDGYRAQAIFIRNKLKQEIVDLNAIVKQIDESQTKIDTIGQKGKKKR